MDLPKAFLVLMTLVVTTLSIPLSTESAKVSCFRSDVPAPFADLYAIINDFCSNNFPTAYTPNPIIFGRTFDLASGGSAEIEVNLDAAVVRLTAGDCHINLAKTVADCEANGKSTGGVYSPIGTGDSEFKVQVNLPRRAHSPTALASPDDCDDNNSTSAISRRDGPSCWIKGAGRPSDRPNVPMLWASQAVHDWCTWMDGKILYKDQEFDNLVNWVVPNIFVTIYAYRTVSIFKEGCMRAFDPLLRTCSDGEWNFSGGYVKDALAEYAIDIRDPVDASSKSTAAIANDSNVAARSASNEAADVFNATESTHDLFTTSCDSDPGSGGLSVDSVKAQGAANYMCLTFDGKAIAKGDQIPALFEDPAQFANIIALDTFTVTTADCDWAYDTLFKACARDGQFYGGTVTFGPGEYVLESPPGGKTSLPAISARDATSFNSTISTNEKDHPDNMCYFQTGSVLSSFRALHVAANLCELLNGKTMQVQDWQSYTLNADGDNPTVKAMAQAYKPDTARSVDDCFYEFQSMIELCELRDEKTFAGGVTSSDGLTVMLEILTGEPETKAIDSSAQGSALTARSSEGGDCQENGMTVDRIHALTAAWDICVNTGSDDWEVNDGATHLYTDSSPWISARIVASQTMSIDFGKCMVAFAALIESCASDSVFCGGTLESEGAKFTLIAVSDTKASAKIIDARTDAALQSRSGSAEPVIDHLTCDPLGQAWVEWDQASNAGIQLCSILDNVPLTAGFDYLNVFQEGLTWVYTQMTAQHVDTSIDYKSCAQIFIAGTQGCRPQIGDHTSGGSIHSGDITFTYWAGDVNTTNPSTLQTRSIDSSADRDPSVQCQYNDDAWVEWDYGFNADIQLCSSLDNKPLKAGVQYINVYPEQSTSVWPQLTPTANTSIDYVSCVKLFEALVFDCRDQTGNRTSGGSYQKDGFSVEYYVGDLHRAPLMPLVNGTDTETTETTATSNVVRRQNNDCLRAEATPVDKQVPRRAIGIFCKQYDGHFLAPNQGVNATWSNSGIDSSMYITATTAKGYMLHFKECVSGFEKLMTDCGDGAADAKTNGGTFVGVTASFSLILVSI